jgi:tetratricopeptide (TPR) repeat protein
MENKMMKTLIFLLSGLAIFATAEAQIIPLNTAPDGGNKKAWVGEQIGIVKIEIRYGKPGVKGREGKIWGTPVAHYGLQDLGHGTSYTAPRRAGANENTTISFSHPVNIEGNDLAAGKYGFFIINGELESTLIFSKNAHSWGSFYYEPEADILRVSVKNQALEKSVEWLQYEFTNQTENSATIALSWEKRKIAFKIEADIHKLQIDELKNDLKTTRPPDDFVTAAQYCLANNIELDQALAWIDRGIYFRIMGEKTFRTMSTKAAILTKLNREDEANKIMEEALPLGTVTDVHFYGRTLLGAKNPQKAMKVFKANFEKHPNNYTTHIGLGRAYSAIGDYKKAIEYMKSGLLLTTDNLIKNSVAGMIDKLEKGIDVN